MGQRLNIEIRKENKVLANAYYHWSGYTSSSLELTSEILDNIDNVNFDNDVVKAIKLLEFTGAGLTVEELNCLSENIRDIEFKKATHRNIGLIAISEEEIKNTQYYEEARIEIHLDTKKVKLDIFFEVDEDDCISELYGATLNYASASFEDFYKAKDEMLSNINNGKYYFIFDNKKFGFIE